MSSQNNNNFENSLTSNTSLNASTSLNLNTSNVLEPELITVEHYNNFNNYSMDKLILLLMGLSKINFESDEIKNEKRKAIINQIKIMEEIYKLKSERKTIFNQIMEDCESSSDDDECKEDIKHNKKIKKLPDTTFNNFFHNRPNLVKFLELKFGYIHNFENYKFDYEFGTSKKSRFIEFIVEKLIYKDLDWKTKKNIEHILEYLLIKGDFKKKFKIIINENKEINYYNINEVYNLFFKKFDKEYKLSNLYKNNMLNNEIELECCCCLSNYYKNENSSYIECGNDKCKLYNSLCSPCYEKLVNKICPLCRNKNIKKINGTSEQIIAFYHNNKEFITSVKNEDFIETSNILLTYFDKNHGNIIKTSFKFITKDEVKKALYDHLKYNICNYKNSFIYNFIGSDYLFLFPNVNIFSNYVIDLLKNENDDCNEILFNLIDLNYNYTYEDNNDNEILEDKFEEIANFILSEYDEEEDFFKSLNLKVIEFIGSKNLFICVKEDEDLLF